MDYELAAARRFLAMQIEHPRARSIINALRPIFRFDDVDATAQPDLDALSKRWGDRVARLEVSLDDPATVPPDQLRYIPFATAWPCAPGDDDSQPATTRRCVTAGHVLPFFLKSRGILSTALGVQQRQMRPGRVVFPCGRTVTIDRWITAHRLDVAVFDLTEDCDGLLLDRSGNLPQTVAPLGYPLVKDVGLYAAIDCHYLTKLFAGSGFPRSPTDYFQHDATTIPGYSGAPVFDPASQRVVGVHVWGSADRPDVSSVPSAGTSSGSDWNDAVLVSAMLSDGWMADILAGVSDTPPATAKTTAKEGGKLPDPGLSPEGAIQDILRRMAPNRSPVAAPNEGIGQDRPDSRDRIYEPPLTIARQAVHPDPGVIGDQANEGSCAAFAVAAAIERQLARQPGYEPAKTLTASVRMLDRMARRHDEWLDDRPDGTSLRAVIKGFYHNGVCPWQRAPYEAGQTDFFLTREMAKDARNLTLGSYLRVRRSVNDMRMAIQEGGAVIVTARDHAGWRNLTAQHEIPYDLVNPPAPEGLHAFVVDGYTEDGFIIQNSRGEGWGGYTQPGHALWSFDDWAANVLDAWVIRLAPQSTKAFAVSVMTDRGLSSTRRIGLLGHMFHAERAGLIEDGTLGLGARGVAETAAYLSSDEGRQKYGRLLLIFHEPLLDGDTVARLALPMTLRLKAQGIYPFHIVYGMDEMLGCRLRLSHDIAQAVERYLREGGSRDMALVRQLKPGIRAQVENYRQGANEAAPRLMREALATLPLFAGGEGRQVQMVSLGLGAIPARALSRVGKEFDVDHLSIASPIPMRTKWVWNLGDQRDEADLPGWRGSWGDLIAAAYDSRIRVRGGAPEPNLQALMARPDFVRQMIDKLDQAG